MRLAVSVSPRNSNRAIARVLRLRRKVSGVAPASLGRATGGHGCQGRTRCVLNGLAGLVPVEVPLEKFVGCVVQIRAELTRWHAGSVVAAGDMDVEGLRPELPLGDVAVVVDGGNLGAENVVAAGDFLGNGDALGVGSVVEDGVRSPVSGLALGFALGVAALAVVDQSALMDLEELEFGLVDLGAVTVAWGEVGGGPAVVAAVPALFALTTGALVVPVEGHGLAGWGVDRVGRRRSIDMGNDVGVVQFVAHDGLPAPALVCPPCWRLVAWVLLGGLTETLVGLAPRFELLNSGVAGHGSDKGREKGSGLEKFGHGEVVCFGDLCQKESVVEGR